MAEPPRRIVTVIDHVHDLIEHVRPQLSISTVPLFRIPELNFIEPIYAMEHIANSVLCSVDGALFLVTADHIWDSMFEGHEPYFQRGKEYWTLPGIYHSVTDPNDADMDFGVWRLDPEQLAGIPNFPYIFNPRGMEVEAPGGEFFLVAGYPNSSFKKWRPISLTVIVCNRAQDPTGRFPEHSHLVLKYDRDNQWGETGPREGKHPRGMSGCGVYRCALLPVNGSIMCELVGVLIEFHDDNDILVAQRIDHALYNGMPSPRHIE